MCIAYRMACLRHFLSFPPNSKFPVLMSGCSEEEEKSEEKDPALTMLQKAISPWLPELNDVQSSDLLTQCLIDRFERENFTIRNLFENVTQCKLTERQIDKLCAEAATDLIKPFLYQIQLDLSRRTLKLKSPLMCHLEIYIELRLRDFVKKIEEESQTLLNEVRLYYVNDCKEKLSLVKAKLKWTEEMEMKMQQTDMPSPLKKGEIMELKEELVPLRHYLKYVMENSKKRNEKELTHHFKELAKEQKEYVTINLQNAVDLYSAVDDLPRDFTDEELYIVEWFITGNLHKPIPTFIKPILYLFMFAVTVLAMIYFVIKGAEITTSQSQEWACLVLVSCALFGFVLEPFKVFMMMVLNNKMNG